MAAGAREKACLGLAIYAESKILCTKFVSLL